MKMGIGLCLIVIGIVCGVIAPGFWGKVICTGILIAGGLYLVAMEQRSLFSIPGVILNLVGFSISLYWWSKEGERKPIDVICIRPDRSWLGLRRGYRASVRVARWFRLSFRFRSIPSQDPSEDLQYVTGPMIVSWTKEKGVTFDPVSASSPSLRFGAPRPRRNTATTVAQRRLKTSLSTNH